MSYFFPLAYCVKKHRLNKSNETASVNLVSLSWWLFFCWKNPNKHVFYHYIKKAVTISFPFRDEVLICLPGNVAPVMFRRRIRLMEARWKTLLTINLQRIKFSLRILCIFPFLPSYKQPKCLGFFADVLN